MNLIIGVSVTIKNFVNFHLINCFGNKQIYRILKIEMIMFFCMSCIFLIFIFINDSGCCGCEFMNDCNRIGSIIGDEGTDKSFSYNLGNKKSIRVKKKEIAVKPLAGFIYIKTEYIKTFINIKGFCKYIISVFTNAKIVFIFFINLCSRMQKLKFKTDYKNNIENKYLLFSIFSISFGLYGLLYFIIFSIKYLCEKNFCWKKNNSNNERGKDFLIEGLILGSLCFVFVSVLVVSIVFYSLKDCENTILYLSIALTGSMNFLLYDIYSCQEVEYISLSGIVSISSLIFRGVEIFNEPFESNDNYILQIILSSVGIVLTIVYLLFFLKKDINFCFCI